MSTRRRLTYIIGGILLTVFVVGAVSVWLLAVKGTMCIVRTGIEPRELYAEDLSVIRTQVLETRGEAQGALVRAFERETGFFLYEANPDGTMYEERNNDIRQLLASRILAGESRTDASILPLHTENLNAIMREWYREEGENGYVYAYEKSKLGANAMLLRVLVASPLFEMYKETAEKLANGILSLQNEDGSFEPWFREPEYAYDREYLLTFYSGEAILALLEYAELAKSEDVLSAAQKAQDFYIGEYVERMDEHYYPAYVPWHTLSLAKLYQKTGNLRYKSAIFVLTDELLKMQDTHEFIGRFYNPETPEYGSPHVSSDAVYAEGLAVAYLVAQSSGDVSRASTYREALIRAYGNLESLQFNAPWYRIFDDRGVAEKLRGGFKTNACDHDIRIDSTAHAIDAFDAMLSAM